MNNNTTPSVEKGLTDENNPTTSDKSLVAQLTKSQHSQINNISQMIKSKSSFGSILTSQYTPRIRVTCDPVLRTMSPPQNKGRRNQHFSLKKLPIRQQVTDSDIVSSSVNTSSRGGGSNRKRYRLDDVFIPEDVVPQQPSQMQQQQLLKSLRKMKQIQTKIYKENPETPAQKEQKLAVEPTLSSGLNSPLSMQDLKSFQIQYKSMLNGLDPIKDQETILARQKDLVRETLFRVEDDDRSPLRKFITRHLIVSTSNLAYQWWRAVVLMVSFASAFFYAYLLAQLPLLPKDIQDSLRLVQTIMELLFVLDMLSKFFVEYHYEASDKVERDIVRIAVLYFHGSFLLDLVTLAPVPDLVAPRKNYNLFYLIKMLRLYNGFALLNYKGLMREVKDQQQQRLKRVLETNITLSQSQKYDQTRITTLIFLKYFMQTLQLILVLLCMSVLTGLIWWKYCDLISSELGQPGFLEAFGIAEEDRIFGFERVTQMSYFMFTTLSTVGLGDYYPTTNAERVLCSIIFLFGVLSTSYIMESLTTITKQLRRVDSDYEESDKLSLFMTVMKKFNHNTELPPALSEEIEEYFRYRWGHDHNHAIKSRKEIELFEQLPKNVQQNIYIEFLFQSFLQVYHNGLSFESFKLQQEGRLLEKRLKIQIDEKVYDDYFRSSLGENCQSDGYRQMLVAILQHLEPMLIKPYQTLLAPNSAVDQVVFFMNGLVKVGYQKSSLRRADTGLSVFQDDELRVRDYNFPVVLDPGFCAIGMFEMVFKTESPYWYRTGRIRKMMRAQRGTQSLALKSFFIRRSQMTNILQRTEELGVFQRNFKLRILQNFLNRIHLPVLQDQDLVMAHRELYKEKLREHFLTKVADYRYAVLRKKYPQRYKEFISRLRNKNLDEEELQHLFFSELKKYPEIRSEVESLPSKETIMQQARYDRDTLSKHSSRVRNQLKAAHLGDMLVQMYLIELGAPIEESNHRKSQGDSDSSESEFGTDSRQESHISQSIAVHSISSASSSSSSGSDEDQPFDAEIVEKLMKKLEDHSSTIGSLISRVETLREALQHQHEIIERQTQEIQYKDDLLKRYVDTVRKFQFDETTTDTKSIKQLFSNLFKTLSLPKEVEMTVPSSKPPKTKRATQKSSFSNLVSLYNQLPLQLPQRMSSAQVSYQAGNPVAAINLDDIGIDVVKETRKEDETPKKSSAGKKPPKPQAAIKKNATNIHQGQSKKLHEITDSRRRSDIYATQLTGLQGIQEGSFGVISQQPTILKEVPPSQFKEQTEPSEETENDDEESSLSEKQSPMFERGNQTKEQSEIFGNGQRLEKRIEFAEEEEKFGSFHEFDSEQSRAGHPETGPVSEQPDEGQGDLSVVSQSSNNGGLSGEDALYGSGLRELSNKGSEISSSDKGKESQGGGSAFAHWRTMPGLNKISEISLRREEDPEESQGRTRPPELPKGITANLDFPHLQSPLQFRIRKSRLENDHLSSSEASEEEQKIEEQSISQVQSTQPHQQQLDNQDQPPLEELAVAANEQGVGQNCETPNVETADSFHRVLGSALSQSSVHN